MSEKKHEHLARTKRQPEKIKFQMTARDMEILRLVSRFRYAKTDQVCRFLFGECKTNQTARRRLKLLFHAGYLGRVECFTRAGQGSFEIAYYLDQQGILALDQYRNDANEDFEICPYSRPSRIKHRFLAHSLAVTDFCVDLLLSLENEDDFELLKLSIDCEIKSHVQRSYREKDRYRLFDKVSINDQEIEIYPDIMFVLRHKVHDKKALYFVEIDRGTERMNILRDKALGYESYRIAPQTFKKKYGKYGVETFQLVLFSAISKDRAENIRQGLKNNFIWVSDFASVDASSLLRGEIWLDGEGGKKCLLA